MTSILSKVLSLDDRVRRATDHYIDDIVVQESIASAEEVRQHLAKYGLEMKEPFGLKCGRLLGFALKQNSHGALQMSRTDISVDFVRLAKRELFSLCSRLVGHHLVAGWLRLQCSFLKRLGCDGAWDSPVGKTVSILVKELLDKARSEDPVRGPWCVASCDPVTVWTDASSLGIEVVPDVGGHVVEDVSWLRKETDHSHTNVAELEAVARGINLAIAWGFKSFTSAVESLTVVSWVGNTINARSRVKTKGVTEMLV